MAPPFPHPHCPLVFTTNSGSLLPTFPPWFWSSLGYGYTPFPCLSSAALMLPCLWLPSFPTFPSSAQVFLANGGLLSPTSLPCPRVFMFTSHGGSPSPLPSLVFPTYGGSISATFHPWWFLLMVVTGGLCFAMLTETAVVVSCGGTDW